MLIVAHHLRGERGLRAAPLRGGQAEQRRRVLEAVLGGHEERVRGDVVDVPELPGRGLREVARRARGRLAGRCWTAPQAASSADAAAEALTSPALPSRRRRVGPSFMLRVSIASSTLGSIFIYLPPGEVPQCSACRHSAAHRETDWVARPPGDRPAKAAADAGQLCEAGKLRDAGNAAIPGTPRAPQDDAAQQPAWAAFAASPVLESLSCSEAGRPRSSGAQPHSGPERLSPPPG